MSKERSSLREEARKAKLRMKNGFWLECHKDKSRQMEIAREQGLNESKVGQYFAAQVSAKIEGRQEDEFYLRVKKMLLSEGEVSDAIGRLTDRAYYESLTYEEKQRYNLTLSERYLRALERFRAECAFECLQSGS